MAEYPTLTSESTKCTRPGKKIALAILFSISAIYFFSFFHRVAIPGTIFDELQSSFGATATVITGLSSLYLYIYGGMQLFAGILNDRYGAARVMLACGLLLSIGSLLFPLSPSLFWLYAARALVGLGASLAFISVVKELDYLFPAREFPMYLGIALFLGYSGGLAGTFPFERAVQMWGWRNSLLGTGILCSAALVFACALFKYTGEMARKVTMPSRLVIGEIFRNRHTKILMLSTPANFAVYFLIQTTLGKKFLTDFCGISGVMATTITFAMMLSTMCIVLLSGFLLRLTGNRRKPLINIAISIAFIGFCLSILGLYAGFGGGWFLFCYILLALSNLSSPLANLLIKEYNPPEAVGTATGLLNTASYLFVAALTTTAGLIMDHFRISSTLTPSAIVYPKEAYLAIFILSAFISLGSLICSFFLRESFGRSLYLSS